MSVRHTICHMRQDASGPSWSSLFLAASCGASFPSFRLLSSVCSRIVCLVQAASHPHLNLWSLIIRNQMYANCARNAFTALANQFNQIFCCCCCRLSWHRWSAWMWTAGLSICTYLLACKLINCSSAWLECNWRNLKRIIASYFIACPNRNCDWQPHLFAK